VCTTLRWRSGETEELTVISNDCEFGGRRTGKDADALITWLTALDEQALPAYAAE
jgi:hypothetical protein